MKEHIDSHKVTVEAEDKIFNKYQQVHLELNRELQTDRKNITHLQENVPSIFNLEDRGFKAHFAFQINYELNPKGSMLVSFDSNTPIEVYMSTQKTKPDRDHCQKILLKSSKFTPKEPDPTMKDKEVSFVYLTV